MTSKQIFEQAIGERELILDFISPTGVMKAECAIKHKNK